MSAAIRHQRLVEQHCTATIRALSHQPSVQYAVRKLQLKGRLYPLLTPYLQAHPERDDYAYFRGAADGIALRFRHSDPELHRQLCPEAGVERTLFDILEQLRVESLLPEDWPGVRRNLEYTFQQWCTGFRVEGLTENQVGMLLYTLANVARLHLLGGILPPETEGLTEATRAFLSPYIGHDLVGLKKTRHDQRAFAGHALNIVALVRELVDRMDKQGEDDKADSDAEGADSQSRLSILLDPTGTEGELGTPKGVLDGEDLDPETGLSRSRYQVFTRELDQEIEAASLMRLEKRRELRQQLDERIAGQAVNVPRLAQRLQRILAGPRRAGWVYGEEEGLLDAGRLARLVTSPGYRQVFKREDTQLHTNTLVTFLIDNSGSMKQQNIQPVAVLVDIMSRALEMAGAKSEILGFTTSDWNGGKALKQWRGRGQPKDPGRLNGVRHIIYKPADRSWRRARPDIATLMKPDFFKESIDGEALLWAYQRLLARREQRRILIVISDGSPMDTATLNANDKNYLDDHLRQVVGTIEGQGQVELYAIGVGLDMSAYYSEPLAMDLSRTLDNRLFGELEQLLVRRARQ